MHDVVCLGKLNIETFIATHSSALIDFSLRLQQWNIEHVSGNLSPQDISPTTRVKRSRVIVSINVPLT